MDRLLHLGRELVGALAIGTVAAGVATVLLLMIRHAFDPTDGGRPENR